MKYRFLTKNDTLQKGDEWMWWSDLNYRQISFTGASQDLLGQKVSSVENSMFIWKLRRPVRKKKVG